MLRNRPGLKDPVELEAFEALSVTQRSEEPFPDGAFDAAHFQAVHHHLFQDVYDWAGSRRTIRTFKDGSPFCYPESFEQELGKLFGWLAQRDHPQGLDADAFAVDAAHFLAELNAIHLFREGNGRAQTAFLAMLAASAGHPLEFDKLDPAAWMQAMIVELLQGLQASGGSDPRPHRRRRASWRRLTKHCAAAIFAMRGPGAWRPRRRGGDPPPWRRQPGSATSRAVECSAKRLLILSTRAPSLSGTAGRTA